MEDLRKSIEKEFDEMISGDVINEMVKARLRLKEAERKIDILKNALLEMLGIEHTRKALAEFELAVRLTPGIEEDKMRAMETINVLRELL